jgi:hypothetical protein
MHRRCLIVSAMVSFLASAPLFAAEPPDALPRPALSTSLHILSNKPLSLHRHVGRFGQRVCDAPCDRVVAYDASDSFSVIGSFVPAPPFRLGPVGPRATLRVDAGSNGALYTGFTASVLGGAAVTMGGLIYVLSVFGDALGSGEGVDPKLERGLVGTMIGGGVALVMGIPLILISQTKVEILPDPRKTRARGGLTFQF